LALACDIVVAAESARFVVAYPKLATSTDGGLSYFLTRRLGTGRALDVLLLLNDLKAPRALELGAIDRVVPDDQLEAHTLAMGEQLANLPEHSVREIKGLVAGQGLGALAEQLAAERAGFLRCCREPEFSARLIAFLDKKK